MTTTDRELLERAAKAAGKWGDDFEIEDDSDQPVTDDVKGFRLAWGRGWWNPLADDGDEARLEAACNIDIEWHTIGVVASIPDKDLINTTDRFREPYADHGFDKQKARRYAGVRAAAAMAGEGE